MSASTPGPWEWWTSNSWRRLRSNPQNGRDVGVLTPFVARDGHPDLSCSEADMALIATSPDLLALAHQYASACDECGGTGFASHTGTRRCEQCSDIWQVIDKAEGRA